MTEQEYARFMEEVAVRAKQISPDTFVSFWNFGSIMDPHRTGYKGEDNTGRVWWVNSPDDEGPAVTALDLMEAHAGITWERVYAREEQWSRDTDLFHGLFR